MDVRVTGRPDETELAALLVVLTRAEPATPGGSPAAGALARWRTTRRAALRRTRRTQQTR